jgi:hypothetical protein
VPALVLPMVPSGGHATGPRCVGGWQRTEFPPCHFDGMAREVVKARTRKNPFDASSVGSHACDEDEQTLARQTSNVSKIATSTVTTGIPTRSDAPGYYP